MGNFTLWVLIDESGRLDVEGFDNLFRQQLEELLGRVRDPRRRASVEQMRNYSWTKYILTSLRNAGFTDEREREEAAAQVVEYLLVSPGKLFLGFDDAASGVMPARFALAVRNAIRNLRRDRRRQKRASSLDNADAVMARTEEPDAEVLDMFRQFLCAELGSDAVELLDRRLDGDTLAAIARTRNFRAGGLSRVRQLLVQVRSAAGRFARQVKDQEFRREVTARLDELVFAA